MQEIANLKENIMEILKNKREKLRLNGIVIDVVKDNEEEYYIILEKEKYWASIVIANPYCAPYKNVSFEIYRVSDAKSGNMRVSNKGVDGTRQMSPDWVREVNNKLKTNSPVRKAIREAISSDKLNTGLVGVDKKTGELIFIPTKITNIKK